MPEQPDKKCDNAAEAGIDSITKMRHIHGENKRVTGGAINVFAALPKSKLFWEYTCHDCGNVAVLLTASGEMIQAE